MIELQNVYSSYPDGTEVLKQINLTIKKGAKIAVLGASGSGKSTLFHHFTGLVRPYKGTVSLNGEVLTYKKKQLQEWRRKIGFVMQNPDMQLFAPTVEEDIMYGPLQLGWTMSEAKNASFEAMEACGILPLRYKPPHALSMGEKKRAAIAGVAAMNPDVFILDEPEAGLDPANVKKLTALINDFHNRGKTVIVSTHHVDFAYEWADQFIILDKGRLIRHDTASIVFSETLPPGIEVPWAYEIGRINGSKPLTKTDALQVIRDLMTKM
ncbi:energy-coupling factor ABC transporter ATP-binding protein [Domibacillus epiphyticus]|nr:ABC transporter ATP-binding protein [Domibacillus epiphyticus]